MKSDTIQQVTDKDDATLIAPATPPLWANEPGAVSYLPLAKIGEFEIKCKLGEGSFGQVYLARQTSLNREVALKVIRVPAASNEDAMFSGFPPDESNDDTRNEGQVIAGLEHDNIVKVYSEFNDKATNSHGLCLQYVPGADLGSVIRYVHATGKIPESGAAIVAALDVVRRGEAGFDPGALRDREALMSDDFAQAACRIGKQMAEALAFAHARGILHCDIKPANILMTPYGRPMLADFNVAFDRKRHAGTRSGIGGTIAYMAPEHRAAVYAQAGATVDERCDIYSLGVVLYELSTGKRPPAAQSPAAPVIADEADPLDRVPRELAAVIRRCLEVNPDYRYQTGGELAAALDGASHLIAVRRALPPSGRIGRWVTANPVPALALTAIVPHLIASVVNITYNAVEVDLNAAQRRAFTFIVVSYDLIAYALCYGAALVLLSRIARLLKTLPKANGLQSDDLRRRVRHFGWWAIGFGLVGWVPGGFLFPFAIDMVAGPLDWDIYGHYIVSFTLGGLIGIVFSYLGVQYVVFRALLPKLGNPDMHSPAGAWEEIRPLTSLFGPFLLLACAVPLFGAVMLVMRVEVMTVGFRLLVAGLIGLGVAGVSIAERLTRALRKLASAWQNAAGAHAA